MRLLSSKEVTSTKKEQQDSLIARGLKVSRLVEDEERKLDQLQAERDQQKTRIQQEFTALFESLNQKRAKLEAEVITLEQRKAEALKPVEDLQRALQKKKKAFDELQRTFTEQEANLQQKEIQLSGQLAELSNLKAQLDAERERFDLKLVQLRAQEVAILDSSQRLRDQWGEFISATETSARMMQAWEQEMTQKEQAFSVLQSELQTQRDSIELNRTRLLDLQATVKAAFDEARAKNLL